MLQTRQQRAKQITVHEAQLQALTAQLLLAKEQERRRIARGLHDHVGQILALARGKLGVLEAAQQSGDIVQSVAEIRALLDQAIQAMRTLTFEFSSPILYELGLEAALESLGEQVEQRHGIRFHFETDRQPKPLTDDSRVMLYHIARELLFNVVKHAHARSATLALHAVGEYLYLTVKCDGVGFDDAGAGEQFAESSGFGLFSMRQQLEHVGGCCA